MRCDNLVDLPLKFLLALFRRLNEKLTFVFPNVETEKIKPLVDVGYLRLFFGESKTSVR